MKVLVTAASKYGSTAEIARAIGEELARHGLDVTVVAPDDVESAAAYDAVVLGSAVYAGRWLGPARALVSRSRTAFDGRAVWLFSSGPVGDPSRKLVKKMGEDPLDLPRLREATRAREHRMFAGKLDRAQLTVPQRIALTVFRGLEGDFRDWSSIQGWAAGIARELGERRSDTESRPT